VELALILGVSELIVGLTVVAVGTSLPELATSIASAMKGRHDMVLGNLIGSNLFNLLLVLSILAMVAGIPLNQDAVTRDYGAMVLVTLLLGGLAPCQRAKGSSPATGRWYTVGLLHRLCCVHTGSKPTLAIGTLRISMENTASLLESARRTITMERDAIEALLPEDR